MKPTVLCSKMFDFFTVLAQTEWDRGLTAAHGAALCSRCRYVCSNSSRSQNRVIHQLMDMFCLVVWTDGLTAQQENFFNLKKTIQFVETKSCSAPDLLLCSSFPLKLINQIMCGLQVQEAVDGATIEECRAALLNQNWNVHKAVVYLKVRAVLLVLWKRDVMFRSLLVVLCLQQHSHILILMMINVCYQYSATLFIHSFLAGMPQNVQKANTMFF